MFPYNVIKPEAQDYVLPAARERDVGVVIMKPFAAGRFFRTDPTMGFRDGELWPVARQSQIAAASLRWILQNDMVHTVIPAMNELRHVDDAVAACASPLSSGDRELLDGIAAKLPTY